MAQDTNLICLVKGHRSGPQFQHSYVSYDELGCTRIHILFWIECGECRATCQWVGDHWRETTIPHKIKEGQSVK